MSKINLRSRKFGTKTARLICQHVYGKAIADSVWRSWRECVGVKKNAHWVEGDHLLSLSAIAWIRKTNKRGSITKKEVTQAEMVISSLLINAIERLDQGMVLGADSESLCRDYGVKPPSQSTLYRRIPRFSKKSYYPNEYILKIA